MIKNGDILVPVSEGRGDEERGGAVVGAGVGGGTEGEQGEHVGGELVKDGVVQGGEPSAVLVRQGEGVGVVEVRQETGSLPRVAGGVQEKLPGDKDFQKLKI
jgi:hypothetical protein